MITPRVGLEPTPPPNNNKQNLKLLKFNNIFYSWNEKIDEPKPEHIGVYKEYTELIDSDTIPVSKVKNIIEPFLISSSIFVYFQVKLSYTYINKIKYI